MCGGGEADSHDSILVRTSRQSWTSAPQPETGQRVSPLGQLISRFDPGLATGTPEAQVYRVES